MEYKTNPFIDLYVTEVAQKEEFVAIFSDILVDHTLYLFERGNVVLRGTQGCGKSMLLNLFRPEIRVAFHKAGVKFPVPERLSRFVGAGINLTRSAAIDIGQRPLSDNEVDYNRIFPLYFADFINYWIVRDILRTFEIMFKEPAAFNNILISDNLNDFAMLLKEKDCWFGYIRDINNFCDLKNKLDERILAYRNYHQYNIQKMPEEIEKTKTSIGEPISIVVDCARNSGIVDGDVEFYIRIDQFEILNRGDDLRDIGTQYKRIVNKALSTRDPRISYRIGTRRYGWGDDLLIFGTDNSLEEKRDYRYVDIDEILRREENRSMWVFPQFAADVFNKRLINQYNLGSDFRNVDLLTDTLEEKRKRSDLAKYYVGTNPIHTVLGIDEKQWHRKWIDYFSEIISNNDPLTAILASAWARQTPKTNVKEKRYETEPPLHLNPVPWEKKWWKKERINQALLQLAGRCRQRMIWSGRDDIIALSGGNILVFLSICLQIWDTYIRSQKNKPDETSPGPLSKRISGVVQTVGIQSASLYWYDKLIEQYDGHNRQKFVMFMGVVLKKMLYNDKPMSYPGRNGFSIKLVDLEADEAISTFLRDTENYGALYGAPHTTKSQDRLPRRKWYLNPVLSPYFQVHEAHTKEPLYLSIEEIRKWISRADVYIVKHDSIVNICDSAENSCKVNPRPSSQLNDYTQFQLSLFEQDIDIINEGE